MRIARLLLFFALISAFAYSRPLLADAFDVPDLGDRFVSFLSQGEPNYLARRYRLSIIDAESEQPSGLSIFLEELLRAQLSHRLNIEKQGDYDDQSFELKAKVSEQTQRLTFQLELLSPKAKRQHSGKIDVFANWDCASVVELQPLGQGFSDLEDAEANLTQFKNRLNRLGSIVAIAKLQDLGLTQEEYAALKGKSCRRLEFRAFKLGPGNFVFSGRLWDRNIKQEVLMKHAISDREISREQAFDQLALSLIGSRSKTIEEEFIAEQNTTDILVTALAIVSGAQLYITYNEFQDLKEANQDDLWHYNNAGTYAEKQTYKTEYETSRDKLEAKRVEVVAYSVLFWGATAYEVWNLIKKDKTKIGEIGSNTSVKMSGSGVGFEWRF